MNLCDFTLHYTTTVEGVRVVKLLGPYGIKSSKEHPTVLAVSSWGTIFPDWQNHHYEFWYDGQRHREGGPAYFSGHIEEWWYHGQRHRVGGPASIRRDAVSTEYSWYENGECIKTEVIFHHENREEMFSLWKSLGWTNDQCEKAYSQIVKSLGGNYSLIEAGVPF